MLGRNRSAAVCLSVYPLCHLCRRFSVFRAFKRLLLAEARYPSGCRAVQTLGEPMAPLKLLGVLPLISAENFCQSSQSKEKAKSFRWLSGTFIYTRLQGLCLTLMINLMFLFPFVCFYLFKLIAALARGPLVSQEVVLSTSGVSIARFHWTQLMSNAVRLAV